MRHPQSKQEPRTQKFTVRREGRKTKWKGDAAKVFIYLVARPPKQSSPFSSLLSPHSSLPPPLRGYFGARAREKAPLFFSIGIPWLFLRRYVNPNMDIRTVQKKIPEPSDPLRAILLPHPSSVIFSRTEKSSSMFFSFPTRKSDQKRKRLL